MTNHTSETEQQDPDRTSTQGAGPHRGEDDRRQPVNPADSPAPRSPAPDDRAVREGEEVLDRVKPY
jgi:hypothetical protein